MSREKLIYQDEVQKLYLTMDVSEARKWNRPFMLQSRRGIGRKRYEPTGKVYGSADIIPLLGFRASTLVLNFIENHPLRKGRRWGKGTKQALEWAARFLK